MEACPNLAEMSDEGFLRAFFRKTEAQGIALYASIELTERCNLGCVHCYLGEQKALHNNSHRELNTEQWCKILDQLTALGCLRLLITGGDPLIRRDFAKIYRHAKQCGLFVTVFTNGTLINDEVIELFRELPPYAVEITLYGATAETYEAITGSPGSFARCLNGIERLKTLGIELGLKTIVMQSNKHELHKIEAMAQQLGNRQFRFDIEIQDSYGVGNNPLSLRLEPDEGVRLEQECPDVANAWADFIRQRRGQTPSNPENLYSCGAAKNGLHVSAYGMLQPCLAVRHVAYDLLNGPLKDGIREIRERLAEKKISLNNNCNGCTDRMVCTACPAFAMQENGIEDRHAEFQCRVTKLRRSFVDDMEEIQNG